MSRTARKLTYADLLALPDDRKRHELIDGEHYMTVSPPLRHQVVLRNLVLLLDSFIHPRRLGQFFFAPLDVFISEHDVVVPDLLYVRSERAAMVEEQFVRGALDLAVEVIAPET